MLDGDIFNLRGEKIGSDGIDDNKVYLKQTYDNTYLSPDQAASEIEFSKNVPFSLLSEKEITADELNLRASLSTLKQTEAGSSNPPLDYNSWNKGDNFTEDSYKKNRKLILSILVQIKKVRVAQQLEHTNFWRRFMKLLN